MQPFPFGKAVSGGRPVDEKAIRAMRSEELARLKAQLGRPPIKKTDDMLSRRLAEELDYAKRLLEAVESELARRGMPPASAQKIRTAEAMLDDLAQIVEAENPCEGVRQTRTEEMRRRLLRRDPDGSEPPCKGG